MKTTLLTLIMLIECCINIHSKNYYVAVGGTRTGTQQSPYGTITSTASQVVAGDTIFIAGGVYSEVNIKPKNSESSACKNNGDSGIDMGAYPLYQFSDMGCDLTREINHIQPYIETLVTELIRGKENKIIIRLTKAAKETTIVRIVPVAGDAIQNVDYQLENNTVTFQPGETNKEVTIRFIGEETEFNKLLLLKLCNEEYIPFEGRCYTAFKLITLAEREAMLNTDIYLEAENGTVGSLWQIETDSKASGSKYVTIKSGNNSNNNAPSDTNALISITFEVTRLTTYILWLRTICPSANNDSFWLRLDNEEWTMWNGIPTSTSWQWNQCPRTYTMLEGTHTLHIGYREDGAQLEKLLFTCLGTIPEGKGEDVTAISTTRINDIGITNESYYDLTGRQLENKPQKGIYIIIKEQQFTKEYISTLI